MVILILKIILAAALTTVPFIYCCLLQDAANKSTKWDNLLSTICNVIPVLGKSFKRLRTRLKQFHKKMKVSINARKLFTLIVFFVMLFYQFVDYQSSRYVAKTYIEVAQKKELGKLSIEETVQHPVILKEQKSFHNYYYPYLSRPLAYLLSAAISFSFFSFSLSDKILTNIRDKRKWFMIVLIFVLGGASFDEGRYMIVSEVCFIISMASLVYPNRVGESSKDKVR